MDPQICYICSMESVFYSRNLFKTKSKYSETRIYDILCKFLGKKPSARPNKQNDENGEDSVCIECLGKIDEYDFATITVQRVETELRELLLRAEALICLESAANTDGGAKIGDENDYSSASPIETFKMLDQFKEEYNCNDLNEPNDSVEAIYEDDLVRSLVIDSDDEYYPPDSRKYRTKIKMRRKAATKGTQQRTNLQLEQQSSLRCAECNVEFKSVAALERHSHIQPDNSDNKSNATSSVSYKCSSCSEILRTKTQYDTHLKQHKEEEEKFKCTICGFDLKERQALDEHTKLHTDLSPLQCVLCKKAFVQKGGLVRHMRIHSGLHFYQCHRCGKGFVHKSSFEMHLMAHDDIRKKQCPHCTQMFRSTSHLNRHLRIHTGSKPYSCPVCSQKFAQRYNMNVHLRLHDTSSNPRKPAKTHICKFCNSSFARLSKLEEHLKKNHEAAIPHTSIGNNLNETKCEKL